MILRSIGSFGAWFGTWVLLPVIFFFGLTMIAKMGHADSGRARETLKEAPPSQTTQTLPK